MRPQVLCLRLSRVLDGQAELQALVGLWRCQRCLLLRSDSLFSELGKVTRTVALPVAGFRSLPRAPTGPPASSGARSGGAAAEVFALAQVLKALLEPPTAFARCSAPGILGPSRPELCASAAARPTGTITQAGSLTERRCDSELGNVGGSLKVELNTSKPLMFKGSRRHPLRPGSLGR